MKTVLFIEVNQFTKKWEELGLTIETMRQLQNELIQEPKIGDLVVGTGGVRKLRFRYEHQGKRSSLRVCYVFFHSYGVFYLLTIYRKKDKENLSVSERKKIKQLVARLLHETRKEFGV